MAVHLANILSTRLETSALVCTRHSGILEKDISDSVKFKCLHKRRTLDFKAITGLRKFIKANKINIIHAHSTSFFIATLLKIRYPSLKIIWHDHYGYRYKSLPKDNIALLICSNFFKKIISVNEKLKHWAEKHLFCKDVFYVQNFSIKAKNRKSETTIKLKGQSKAFKIIHVANLRPEKDHITALQAIKILSEESLNITYHLIGGFDINSEYYKNILEYIDDNNLKNHVFIYDSQSNISGLLQQANVGILSSVSEGLPVSLIEYAQSKLPVIVTDVGQCKSVVGDFAKVIDVKDYRGLSEAIKDYLNNPCTASTKATKLFNKISKEYNPENIINKIISIYTSALK